MGHAGMVFLPYLVQLIKPPAKITTDIFFLSVLQRNWPFPRSAVFVNLSINPFARPNTERT